MQKDLRNKYLRLYRILYQMMEYDRKKPIPEDEEEICRILKETYHISNKRSRKIIIRLLETAFGNRLSGQSGYPLDQVSVPGVDTLYW